MPEYRVVWEIELEADHPLDAAKEAFSAMQDPDSLASVFTVMDQETGQKTLVDLKSEDVGPDQ